MGPGWPPYDCGIKTFHSVWYNTEACDSFNPKAGRSHLKTRSQMKQEEEQARQKKAQADQERRKKEMEAQTKNNEQERIKRESIGLSSGEEIHKGKTFHWYQSAHTGQLTLDIIIDKPGKVMFLDEKDFSDYLLNHSYSHYGGEYPAGNILMRLNGKGKFYLICTNNPTYKCKMFNYFKVGPSNQTCKKTMTEAIKLYYAQKYEEAYKLLPPLIEAKYPEALNLLAILYHKGLYVEKNPQTAFELYGEAVSLGNPSAMCNLSEMYSSGIYIPQNLRKAHKLNERAAKCGLPLAHFQLAADYQFGLGVEANPFAAIKHYELAAEEYPQALYYIGKIYIDNLENEEKGLGFIKQAADKGVAEAKQYLIDKDAKERKIAEREVEERKKQLNIDQGKLQEQAAQFLEYFSPEIQNQLGGLLYRDTGITPDKPDKKP